MPKFELTFNGERYEVEAPDEQSALAAFQANVVGGASTPQVDPYQQSLEAIRQSQFPDMTDQQWQEYSQKFLAPYDFQQTAQQTQTFGFGDEINAGVGAFGSQVRNWLGDQNAPGFGEAYSQYEALERARRDVGREQLGPMAIAADVAGAFSGVGPARGAGAGSLPIPFAGNQAQLIAGAVTSGGLMGFAGGFGTADEDRLDAAAIGAGIGTVAGRFGPTLANAVSGGYENIANSLARNRAAQQVGISPGTASFIGDALAVDDALSNQGLARMLAAGDERMLVDSAPSARRMLDTSIQASGRAGQTARTAINERVTRDSQAIQEALNQTLGFPEGVDAARARIAAETAAPRSAAYKAADAVPIDYSSQAGYLLDDLLARVPQEVINRANRLMKIRGEDSAQIMAQIDDAGNVTYLKKPDVRQIDYITRALNEEADAGIGMGAMGGQTTIGSSLQSLSGDIRTVLGNHVPEYAEALSVAGDSIRRSQATKLGYDLLNPQVTMEDVIRESQKLSPADRQGLAQGLRSRIEDMIARVTRTLGNPDTEAREAAKALVQLSSRATRTKIEAAIGEELAAPLFAELDRAGMSFELAQSVADGSQTFARQNQQQRILDLAGGGNGPLNTIRRGEPVNAGKRVVQALTGMTDDAIYGRQDVINQEIARLLVASGQDADQAWRTMQGLTNAGTSNAAIAQALLGTQRVAVPTSNYTTQRISAARQ